jgi:hypothetical protein
MDGTAPHIARDRVAAWVKLRKAAAKPGELISDGPDLRWPCPVAPAATSFSPGWHRIWPQSGYGTRVSLGDSADLRLLTRLPVIRP